MNVSELIDKFGFMVNEELTEKELWKKAEKGDISILSDPRTSIIKKHGFTPLHTLAYKGIKEVLNHPEVSTLKDMNGGTPLHMLAYRGVKEVLDHLDAGRVKEENGWTPLHWLAHKGVKDAWLHPDFYEVKNNKNETPKDVWIIAGHKPLSAMDLAELKYEN